MGEREVCLSCGYGSSFITDLVAEAEDRSIQVSFQGRSGMESSIHRAVARFGFKLLAEISQLSPERNILFSPVGLARAFSLMAGGAEGETRQAILNTLDFQDYPLEEVHQEIRDQQETLARIDPGRQFGHSTSLWVRKGMLFQPGFLAENEQSYQVEILDQSFSDPATPVSMSAWLGKHSQARLSGERIQVDPLSVLYILSAAALRPKWQIPFKPEQTVPGYFTLPDGLQKKTHFMKQSGWYACYREDEFQIAALPLGEGQIRLVLLLPDPGSSLETIQKKLVVKRWEQWLNQLQMQRGEISLPRCSLESMLNLSEALVNLGMGMAFDEFRANFESMCPIPPMPDIYIGQVWQRASLVLSEESAPEGGSVPLEQILNAVQTPFILNANRPFFFAVQDVASQAILLMGTLSNPR